MPDVSRLVVGPGGDYEAALADAPEQGEVEPPEIVGDGWPTVMAYTSGTTGRPKGVAIGEDDFRRRAVGVAASKDRWGFSADDVHLLVGPSYHMGPMFWAQMHLAFGGSRKLGPGGASDPLGKTYDPVHNSDPCWTVKGGAAKGSLVLKRTSPGFTLAGATTVIAKVKTTGGFGQIDARLWDVTKGKRRLIDTSTYRLKKKQKGKITFQLFGNEYKFAKGHTIELELVGHDSPVFLRDTGFKVKLSTVSADVPTREKPNLKRGIVKPPKRH